MRKAYASDISKEKFEEIRSVLEGVRKRTKPTTVDLYEVFCGVLYVLRTACQWRMLPREYPNWVTVYSYWLMMRFRVLAGRSGRNWVLGCLAA